MRKGGVKWKFFLFTFSLVSVLNFLQGAVKLSLSSVSHTKTVFLFCWWHIKISFARNTVPHLSLSAFSVLHCMHVSDVLSHTLLSGVPVSLHYHEFLGVAVICYGQLIPHWANICWKSINVGLMGRPGSCLAGYKTPRPMFIMKLIFWHELGLSLFPSDSWNHRFPCFYLHYSFYASHTRICLGKFAQNACVSIVFA